MSFSIPPEILEGTRICNIFLSFKPASPSFSREERMGEKLDLEFVDGERGRQLRGNNGHITKNFTC